MDLANSLRDPRHGSGRLRPARPADYNTICTVVDGWWGRPMVDLLPRLFLDHFHTSSLVGTTDDGALAAFLVGFRSPSEPEKAYIHFVGVAPSLRGEGWGRRMYQVFLDAAANAGCQEVSCVTSPINEASLAFHQALGFTVTGPHSDYDGPERTLMRMSLQLGQDTA